MCMCNIINFFRFAVLSFALFEFQIKIIKLYDKYTSNLTVWCL